MNRQLILMVSLMLGLATAALAVKPGTWSHQTEADFAAGETEHTIVTNLGEVQLARATRQLATLEGDDSIIYDIVRYGEDEYLAIGPEGKLARYHDESLTVLAEYEGEQVFALASTDAGLWVAVSGAKSRLEFRNGEALAVQTAIELPEVRYVWDMVIVGDRMYLATGDKGQVLWLEHGTKEPKINVALDTQQPNVLCLGADDEGRVYAGTDGEGLIYRLTPSGGEFSSFVLYDAPEPEIGALLVLPDGTAYAGTADAQQARPGRLEQAVAEARGRPEIPAQDKPTEIPNVPPKPEPKPGAETAATDAKPAAAPDAADADAAKPAVPAVAEAAKPTTEQYDALRAAIRERLDQARKSGTITMQAQSGSSTNVSQRLRSRASTAGASRPSASGKQGNAIYRISPEGFVSEVFRESVMILRIVQGGAEGALLVGTGSEGELYRVTPGAEEVTTIADLEPQQIPALFDMGNGEVLLGTANPGRLMAVSNKFADSGTLTSDSLDAQQISLFGKLQVTAATPGDASIAIQTRSGNVKDTESGAWSEWSEPQTLKFDGGRSAYVEVASPAARFLQYRLTLKSEGEQTPSVNSISLKYLMPNMAPRIASIKTEYTPAKRSPGAQAEGAAAPPQTTLKVEWEAADANNDAMTYVLEASPFGSDAPFVEVAKDLTANNYEWDTRTTPDGRYTLRVTASDAADNPPGSEKTATRRSDPVVVDNAPPALKVEVEQAGKDAVTVTAAATDALSPVTEIRYTIDSEKEWQLVLPEDLIFDSTGETAVIKITGLSPGRHVVTVRAGDVLDNSAYIAQSFEIKP